MTSAYIGMANGSLRGTLSRHERGAIDKYISMIPIGVYGGSL